MSKRDELCKLLRKFTRNGKVYWEGRYGGSRFQLFPADRVQVKEPAQFSLVLLPDFSQETEMPREVSGRRKRAQRQRK